MENQSGQTFFYQSQQANDTQEALKLKLPPPPQFFINSTFSFNLNANQSTVGNYRKKLAEKIMMFEL
jgi:hypothetical protein